MAPGNFQSLSRADCFHCFLLCAFGTQHFVYKLYTKICNFMYKLYTEVTINPCAVLYTAHSCYEKKLAQTVEEYGIANE